MSCETDWDREKQHVRCGDLKKTGFDDIVRPDAWVIMLDGCAGLVCLLCRVSCVEQRTICNMLLVGRSKY